MKIYNLQIKQDAENVRLSVSIESERLGLKELWFSTPVKYGDYLCKSRMDGFLVGMLFPAMQYGENIHLEGCVSKKLLFNMNNHVVPLLMGFSPSCKFIKITADKTSSERFNSYGVGTGFSGGVDSFCTFYERFELEADPEYKINSLLFLNVGSHGWGEGKVEIDHAKTKFLERYAYLRQFPDENKLDYIPLDSNLHAFTPWGHLKTCSLTMASAILLLQAHYRKYYCASLGWSYFEVLQYYKTDLDKSTAMLEPILLPLLSTESLDLIPDGWQYTRVEKTFFILHYEPVLRYLNVCISGDEPEVKNCSVCGKCCRTLMTLNSVGKLNDFGHLFDVPKYKKKAERRYVCEQVLLTNKDPFARGNIELAKRSGVRVPSRFFCYTVSKASLVKKFTINTFKLVMKPVLPASMFKRMKRIVRRSGG